MCQNSFSLFYFFHKTHPFSLHSRMTYPYFWIPCDEGLDGSALFSVIGLKKLSHAFLGYQLNLTDLFLKYRLPSKVFRKLPKMSEERSSASVHFRDFTNITEYIPNTLRLLPTTSVHAIARSLYRYVSHFYIIATICMQSLLRSSARLRSYGIGSLVVIHQA